MDGMNIVVGPAGISLAAGKLHMIANEIEAILLASTAATNNVLPSGAEEVSFQLATHFNRGGLTHTAAAHAGVEQLRHAANTLLMHLAEYEAKDAMNSVALKVFTGKIV